MTMRILWPAMPPEFDEVAREAVGPGIETIFHRSAAEVSDAEWMSADAIVGPYPGAEAVGKWARARIYVKASVGFDEVDIERLGGMGVAGTVEIWGSPLRRISVEMPTTVELRAADGSVATVTNFRTDLKKNPNLGLFGYLKFNFGGELRVTAGQAGQFRGRIPITVEYD